MEVEANSPNGVSVIEYYIDDQKKFFTDRPPYTATLFISKFYEKNSKHLLVAKIIDQLGYSSQSAIEIKVGTPAEPEEEEEPVEEEPVEEETPPTVEIILPEDEEVSE